MMVETNLMRGWAGIVESAALFALIVLALGLIVSAVKPEEFAKHLGTILGMTILLLMLPAILVNAWSSMSHWQRVGIVILGILIGISLSAMGQAGKKR
jgi:hypothetical protein